MELEKGDLFQEQYRIVDVAGRGGNAVVYEAIDEILQRVVAIKVLLNRIGSETDLRSFLREAKILSSIEDKNVVRIFRIGLTEDHYPFFVMEHLNGQTLRERLSSHSRLALGPILEVGKAICAGMILLESKNVLHRDLKPENIFLDEVLPSNSKIMDFGISKTLDDTQTLGSAMVGTASYMSPEQCRGAVLDIRSDIYSFCCVFFEALCGQQLFYGETQAEVLSRQLSEPPALLKNEKEGVSARIVQAVNAFLQKGLQKDPEKRHQSFCEVLSELESIERISSDASMLGSTFVRLEKQDQSTAFVAPKAFQVTFVLLLVVAVLWLIFGLNKNEDSYYQNTAEPEAAIKFFDRKIRTFLSRGEFEEANNLVDATAYQRLNVRWSKDDQRRLLKDYFLIYRQEASAGKPVSAQVYNLAQAYFENLLNFASNWCISHFNAPMPEAIVQELQAVSKYLSEHTKEKQQWLALAKIFSKNSHAFPTFNPDTFVEPALLRFQAEQHCPGKCGEDKADFGKHCIALIRMHLTRGDLAEFQRVSEMVKKGMLQQGQMRHQLVVRMILANKYASAGRIDLAEQQQIEIAALGNRFGFKSELEYGLSNEELRAFCSMRAAMGSCYCRRRDLKNARVQLDELNKGLQELRAINNFYLAPKNSAGKTAIEGFKGELREISPTESGGFTEVYDFLQQYQKLFNEKK